MRIVIKNELRRAAPAMSSRKRTPFIRSSKRPVLPCRRTLRPAALGLASVLASGAVAQETTPVDTTPAAQAAPATTAAPSETTTTPTTAPAETTPKTAPATAEGATRDGQTD